jgi:hypothetical protein
VSLYNTTVVNIAGIIRAHIEKQDFIIIILLPNLLKLNLMKILLALLKAETYQLHPDLEYMLDNLETLEQLQKAGWRHVIR